MQATLRPSPIAGTWYPADPCALTAELDSYLEAASNPKLTGQVVGVITPHAGTRYSGPVAAHAFEAARGLRPELVAVLSPMHQPYRERLLTSAHSGYWTPLGSVPVDRERVDQLGGLLSQQGIELSAVRLDAEHSLEIELPFLQRVYSHPFRLLPVMVRDVRAETCRILGEALAQVLEMVPSLIVISTDLSHFYPAGEADALDREMLAAIATLDPQQVLETEQRGTGFACGLGAVAAGLGAAVQLGADRAVLLRHATSGDITGDRDSVVGYGAVALVRSA